MNGIAKETLPFAVESALQQAGLNSGDFPGLALRLLNGAIVLSPSEANPKVAAPRGMEWLGVNPAKNTGTRVAGNAMNPLGVAAAVLSTASAEISLASCVAAVVALAAACSSILTKDQAALLVALTRLEGAQQIPSALAVATKMTNSLGRNVDAAEAVAVAAQLQAVGVPFTVGPLPHQVIQCHEAIAILPRA